MKCAKRALSHERCPGPRRKNSIIAVAVASFCCESRQQNVKTLAAFAFVRLRRYIFVLIQEVRNETDGWIDWAGIDGQADGAESAEGRISAGGVESDGGASGRAGERGRETGCESARDGCGRGCADHDCERSAGAGRNFVGRRGRDGRIAARKHLHGFEHDFTGAGAARGDGVRRARSRVFGCAGDGRRLGREERRTRIHDWREGGSAGARAAGAGGAGEEIFLVGTEWGWTDGEAGDEFDFGAGGGGAGGSFGARYFGGRGRREAGGGDAIEHGARGCAGCEGAADVEE